MALKSRMGAQLSFPIADCHESVGRQAGRDFSMRITKGTKRRECFSIFIETMRMRLPVEGLPEESGPLVENIAGQRYIELLHGT